MKIAKNYLSELELQRLNLLTSQFLDYAEFQALEQNPMTMADWISALDDQIVRLRKNILKATELFPTKKPLKRQSESLKSIESEKCGCWKATSTRLSID